MTPRYARLAGWLLLAGVVGTVFACSAPAIGGSGLDGSNEQAASGDDDDDTAPKKKSKSTSAPVNGDDDDDTVSSTVRTTTTASVTSTPTATAPPVVTATATATATATTPPPVVQPNCANDADPLACLQCCELANPGATDLEDAYDTCLVSGGDLDTCKTQHLTLCAQNTSCMANHACMQANNCLASNLCE